MFKFFIYLYIFLCIKLFKFIFLLFFCLALHYYVSWVAHFIRGDIRIAIEKNWHTDTHTQIQRNTIIIASGEWYIQAPWWYSGHGLRSLHRQSWLDSHSRQFTCGKWNWNWNWIWIWIEIEIIYLPKKNEPLSGSTHALWGKLGLGSQSKVLTGHWLTKCL